MPQESIFLHYAYFKGGCRNTPYTPIAGSGPRAATLHYGGADAPNKREIADGDLVLLDMGTEYYRHGRGQSACSNVVTVFVKVMVVRPSQLRAESWLISWLPFEHGCRAAPYGNSWLGNSCKHPGILGVPFRTPGSLSN